MRTDPEQDRLSGSHQTGPVIVGNTPLLVHAARSNHRCDIGLVRIALDDPGTQALVGNRAASHRAIVVTAIGVVSSDGELGAKMGGVMWWIVATGIELAVIVGLGVLLIVSRRKLSSTRRALDRALNPTPRKRRGLAPFAIRTAFQAADSLINKGIGATVRNSVEDLAGWAKVERPDLARITADGDVVVVFSDIEGSTARNEELGDRGWVKLLEKHNRLICKQVEDHGGHVVKNQGDGYMIAFPDAAQAVRCGIRVQEALRENPDRWDRIRVRMGIHVGSSVRRGDDLFGLNVAMAARVAGQAEGGEILVSETVKTAIATAHDLALGTPREVELKGMKDRYQLYPVELPGRIVHTDVVQQLN